MQQTGFYQPSSPNQTLNKVGKTAGKGCLFIIGGIFFVIILILAVIFFIYPAMTPNTIRGDFQEMTYLPGSQKLWIQTDGSFKYIEEVERPGYKSTGVEGLFCKTYTYLYDPIKQEVVKVVKKDLDHIPVKPQIYFHDGKVWVASQELSEREPQITVYNSETVEELMDTKAFIDKYPEQLSAGLASLRFLNDPYGYELKSKDGRECVYLVDKDTLLASFIDYRAYQDSISKGAGVRLLLGNEKAGGNERKKLYRLKGPQDFIQNASEHNLHNPETVRSFYQAEVDVLTPNRVYLDPEIIGMNTNGIVILHQDKIGKNAERSITFVSNDGSIAWTKPQSSLFGEDMGVNEDDPFSTTFFMKDNFKAEINNGLIIFKFDKSGIIALDMQTGSEKWRLDI